MRTKCVSSGDRVAAGSRVGFRAQVSNAASAALLTALSMGAHSTNVYVVGLRRGRDEDDDSVDDDVLVESLDE